MDLQGYMRVLRKRWASVAVVTALGLVVAFAYSKLATPTYQATTEVFVSVSGGTSTSDLLQGNNFTQQRVQSYASLVTSPIVLQPVVDQLKLGTTPQSLAGQIMASSPLDTVIIEISVIDTSADEAAAIANATAKSLATQVAQLEKPVSGQPSPVKVSVVSEAVPPTSPSSPRTKINLLLGVITGLALGIGYALLRDTLDTSIRRPEDLQVATGTSPLGIITFDPDAKSKPLAALDPHSSRSEAFRMIRTNLQFVDVDNPPRRVVITSAVPNEGKTTTACNLAITLGQAGLSVCLVEADLRRPRLAEYLGIESAVGLTNVLAGQNSFDEVVILWNRGLVSVLPSGPVPPNPSELLGSHNMALLLDDLAVRFDVVVLDAPPLLPVTDGAVLAATADGAILVTRHGHTTREQLARAVEALGTVNARLLGTVLNFVPPKAHGSAYGYGYGYADDGSHTSIPPGVGSLPRTASLTPQGTQVGLEPSPPSADSASASTHAHAEPSVAATSRTAAPRSTGT